MMPALKPPQTTRPMKSWRCGWLVLLSAMACAPEPSVVDAPNILFIVSDDLNVALGCYGHEVCRTPNIDRLAGEGVRFDRAYAQFPMCGPSRTSFLSGLYPTHTKILYNNKETGSYRATNPALADHPGIGGFLRQCGYFSARISKIYHMRVPAGIEAGEAGGDDPEAWDRAINVTAAETKSPGQLERLANKAVRLGFAFSRIILPDEEEHTQADYKATTEAISILEERAAGDSDQPFFLAVGLVRPHVPLIAPKRLFDHYPDAAMRLPEVSLEKLEKIPLVARFMENSLSHGMSIEQQRKTVAAYYASVSFVDEQVGRLLAALDRLDLRKDTIVVFTSDHGYSLGERDSWQKNTLFEEVARVPLIVSVPGMEKTAGQTSPRIVELIDLYPTFADLAGLGDHAPSILQGMSLRPLLEEPSREDWPKQVAYTWTVAPNLTKAGPAFGESLRTDRWRYNRWEEGKKGEELYDHQADPLELDNLAGVPEHAGVLAELRAKLLPRRPSRRLRLRHEAFGTPLISHRIGVPRRQLGWWYPYWSIPHPALTPSHASSRCHRT